MNRRDLLKAAIAAPWVITTAGVLMPVRSLSRPRLGVDLAAPGADRGIYVRLSGRIGADGFMIRELSSDGMKTWRADQFNPALVDQLTRSLEGFSITLHYPAPAHSEADVCNEARKRLAS